METRHLLGDDPVNAAGDELDRQRFSDHVIQVLNRVRQQSESSVIALIGPWGSGKSSLLEMITDSIDELTRTAYPDAPEWRVADFNPWIHSDPVSMYVGFYSEIRSCLDGRQQWSEARESIGKWVQNAAPLGKLGGVARIDASSILEKLAETISGDTGAAAKKEKAEAALKECGVSILVVMDDLDRLTPEELLEVFKLIRLVGRLPNVYYLLSYDEKTLIDVLRRTDLAFGETSRANDYLEKIIQVRLDIPQLTRRQKLELADASLDAVRTNSQMNLSEEALKSIAALWADTLSSRLTTPRTIRRFFAQVDASYITVAEEVSFEDFLALTFLRTHEHRVYSEIQNHAGELTMHGFHPRSNENLKDRLERWTQNLRKWDVSDNNIDGVLQLLGRLFLPIKSALAGMEYGNEWLSEIARNKGVGHSDYFTRYFFFGVPSGDVSDAAIERAMTSLTNPTEGGAAATDLTQALKSDPERVIRKIRHFGALSQEAADRLLGVMADAYLSVPHNIGFLSSFSRHSIEALAEDLLSAYEPSALPDLLHNLTQSDGGYCLAVRGLRIAKVRARRADRAEDTERFNTAITEIISNKFQELRDVPLEEIEQTVFATVHQWVEADDESVRIFLRGQAEDNIWQLLHILERLVNRGTASTHAGTVLMGLEDETVDSILGLDYVFSRLSSEIDAASTDVLMVGLPDTPVNRRSVALAALNFARNRRSGVSEP
ncbi:P-loop NTPase fold protein [Streptomyces sp. NPDC002238]|uniref:KAP family P-loop NTPase fold protein n=1 Tax=Streptomyces sp. NPDC002238 TaxID=3156649 RepID=UPI00331F3086